MDKPKAKPKSQPKFTQGSLLELLIEEEKRGGGVITSMLSLKPSSDVWRGVLAVPPGSLVEDVVGEFDAKTNIPLELPFFSFFHFLAGYLLNNNINMQFHDENGDNIIIQPDIWTVVLADSGSGKTFTTKTIERGIPELKKISFDIAGIASTARFIDDLKDNNRKLFIRDEFNEFYRQLNGISGPLSELKDVFLRLYNNETISRKRRDDEINIQDAAIAFLGMTVTKSFSNTLTADDLINGFAQRFSFVIAQKDPNKRMIDYPIYSIKTDTWNIGWEELIKSIKYKTYIADDKALAAFKTSFSLLANRDLDESFFRRQMWRANKYALIYHILLGDGDRQIISPSCYGWAARMIHLLIQDCVVLLEEHGWSEIESSIQKVEALQKRMEAEGKNMTLRDIVRRIRSIRSISEAKAIMSLLDRKTVKIGGDSPSKGKVKTILGDPRYDLRWQLENELDP